MPKLYEYNNIKINKGRLILYEINKFPVENLEIFSKSSICLSQRLGIPNANI